MSEFIKTTACHPPTEPRRVPPATTKLSGSRYRFITVDWMPGGIASARSTPKAGLNAPIVASKRQKAARTRPNDGDGETRGSSIEPNAAQWHHATFESEELIKLENPQWASREIRALLAEHFSLWTGGIDSDELSEDGTRKWLLRFDAQTAVDIGTPGAEGADNAVLWLPREKILFSGDFFGPQFPQFPNIFTMRGEKVRKPVEYIRSLDLLLELQPEVIVPSHLEPTRGAAEFVDRGGLALAVGLLRARAPSSPRATGRGLRRPSRASRRGERREEPTQRPAHLAVRGESDDKQRKARSSSRQLQEKKHDRSQISLRRTLDARDER